MAAPFPRKCQPKILLDTASRVKAIYVYMMSCHIYRARTLNWPWARLLRADLDKGGLKVEPAFERQLTQNTGASPYFQRRIVRRVLGQVSTQNEGTSNQLIENKGRGICLGDVLNLKRRLSLVSTELVVNK
jgi:hypothetical protein